MKIILNAYQYSDNITGTDRMSYNFIKELQELDTSNTYYVITSHRKYIPSIIKSSNFQCVHPPSYIRRLPMERRFSWLWRKAAETYLRAKNADVYVSFHNMKLPAKKIAKKQIAFNLDLIPLVLDEYREKLHTTKDIVLKQYMTTVENADKFISISNFSAKELVSRLNVSINKISVVPLAADGSAFSKSTQVKNLPEKFIFTIGGGEPRKNVGFIANAHSTLPEKLQKEYPLIIVGGTWHGINPHSFKKSDHIKVIGYVSDTDLTYLYRHASFFVFGSLYEGFGLTVLEAMSLGTPVLCSSTTSVGEVAKGAALTFNPADTKDLESKLKILMENEQKRNDLAKVGLDRSKEFSWKSSSEKLLQVMVGI